MKDSGYFGIGCLNMKTKHNYGSLFRTAQILNADFIFLIGSRFKHQATDTMCSYRHMPLFIFNTLEQFKENRPFNCKLIGIELHKNATPIKNFVHPKQCMYLLGAEDNGLTKEAMEMCQELVVLPGERSMNVAVAGSIILYDRIMKA